MPPLSGRASYQVLDGLRPELPGALPRVAGLKAGERETCFMYNICDHEETFLDLLAGLGMPWHVQRVSTCLLPEIAR